MNTMRDKNLLKEWILFINEYIYLNLGSTLPTNDNLYEQEQITIRSMNRYSWLKETEKEIVTIVKHTLSRDQIRELNSLLRAKFGRDLSDAKSKTIEKINAIRAAGKIHTPTQFRMIMEYVDEIYADPEKQSELEELNKLLAHYERPGKRARDI